MAAIGFAVLWIVLSVQMATGNDPVLSQSAANVSAAAKESVASDPERRTRSAAVPSPAKRSELETAAQAEEVLLEAEQIEAEELELEAVTTSQS
ncbi:MAG: hypothetical protein JJE35_01620 [Thermoleophilia bacterium]|nr:hypothetical protein [Thermoleophilia bacterium]